jgi:hypothetical protein
MDNTRESVIHSEVLARELPFSFGHQNGGGAGHQGQSLKDQAVPDHMAGPPVYKRLPMRGEHARNAGHFCGKSSDEARFRRVGGQNIRLQATKSRRQLEKGIHIPDWIERFLQGRNDNNGYSLIPQLPGKQSFGTADDNSACVPQPD